MPGDRSKSPTIFVSFPKEAEAYVEIIFGPGSNFRSVAGWDPVIHTYTEDPALIGSHNADEESRVRRADVFIAILHLAFIDSPACVNELRIAIQDYQRRKQGPNSLTLCFLMVEDEPKLRQWWTAGRRDDNGLLQALEKGCVYSPMWLIEDADTDGGKIKFAKRVQRLVKQLRNKIQADDQTKADPSPVGPGRAATADIALLLGAADRPLATKAGNALTSLQQKLNDRVPERVVRLNDGWFTRDGVAASKERLTIVADQNPIVVQTCDPDLCDSLTLAAGPDLLRQQLAKVHPDSKKQLPGSRLVIWLPRDFDHREFSMRAAAHDRDSTVDFQHATPDELASGLLRAVGASDTKLRLFIRDPGNSPIDALLAQGFERELGGQSVNTETWESTEGLKAWLNERSHSDSTLLVAIHDLVGSAFDLDQAVRRLEEDAVDVAKVLQSWKQTLGRPLVCLPAMICQRTRASVTGAVSKILNGEKFRYIRVEEAKVNDQDIRRVLEALHLIKPPAASLSPRAA